MKKTYIKNILRTVRRTMSRFGAIFAIVALGVGFLSGLLATTPDMYDSSDAYFDDTNLFDMRIVSTLGLTDDDVEAIKKTDGVKEVMPAYYTDVLVSVGGSEDAVVTRFHSLPATMEDNDPEGYINRLEVTQGRLPVKDGECVVLDSKSMLTRSVSVGDTIVVKGEDTGLADEKYKITGVVTSSSYFSMERETSSIGNGSITFVAFTGEQSFTSEAYTDVYLTVDGAKELGTFTDEYEDTVKNVSDKIEAISAERCEIRYNSVKTEAENKLSDAKKEYEDAKAEAEEKLSDARKQLDEGQAEIAKNEKTLEDAKKKIDSGEKELSNTQNTLTGTLTEKQQQLIAGKQALIDAKAQYDTAKEQLDAGAQQLATLKTTLTVAQSVVDAAAPEVKAYQTQLETLKAQLDTSQESLDAAQTAYNEAQKKVDDAIAAGGYASEEEYKSAEPVAAALLIAQRDTAAETLKLEQTKYDAINSSYNTVHGSFEAANARLEEAQRQINEYSVQVTEGEKKLAEGKVQLAAAQKQILEAEKQVTAGETSLSLAPDLARLQIELAKMTLESSKQQVADGEEQLDTAKKEIASGEDEYAKQKKSAEEKLADAQKQIADGEKQLAELEVPEWYRLTRNENVSFVSLSSNIDKVDAIARIFPVFFFLVAALVALTTMTRMVEEERLQIGTLKALGFSKTTIMIKYIVYAIAASASGSLCGILIGFKLFPAVIWNAYSMMYTMPPIQLPYRIDISSMAAGIAVACTLAATLNAAWATLCETPAQLMRPRAPKAGKRILLERIKPVWKRMPFTYKVTARNIFLYKKRFIMTLVGISGCTALLVCGFGLHDSISDIVNVQYGKVLTYDASATLEDNDAINSSELQNVLSEEEIKSSLAIHQEKSKNTYDGMDFNTYIFVPENDAQFSQFVTLRHRIGHEGVPFTSFGVVITEKMSERTGYGVGDAIELKDTKGNTGVFTITGVAENYIENYVYMNADLYEEQFGGKPEFSTLLMNLTENTKENRDSLAKKLLGIKEVTGVSFVADFKESFSNMMTKIDMIVVVLIISAGALAFIVLYNLINININERSKEIATIKVLGFYDSEVYKYVYRETIMLSLIGTLAGLVLGIFMHKFIIFNVELDAMMFGRTIKWYSYVFSAALTMIFSVIVELVMRRKLRSISMVESMKAPE